MRLQRLNKVIEENDPERIREYKLLGFVEEGREPEGGNGGREPVPLKPAELTELPKEKTGKRGKPAKNDLI